MATTKSVLVEAIRTALATISGVKKAAVILELPDNARNWAPYIGVIAAGETPTVVDTTHVRYLMNIDLVLVYNGTTIDTLIDGVRDVMLATSRPAAAGALDIRLVSIAPVTIIAADNYSSTRLRFEVLYTSER